MEVQPGLYDEYVYLAGRSSVREFVNTARRHKVNGYRPDKDDVIREWQRAHDLLRELEKTEAGAVDSPETYPLPAEMLEVIEAEADEASLGSTKGASGEWRLIELDKLVVFQPSINLRYIAELKAAIPAEITPANVARTAIGNALGTPSLRITRSADYCFMCASNSNDVRVLEIDTFDLAQIPDYQPPGKGGAVIGICVGYSSNVLTVTQIRNRLILTNGSHRAFALRDLGVTHAPCVVIRINREDEIDMRAPEPVRENRELYLRSPRPPMFKDYFDPRLRKIMLMPRSEYFVQLQIGYQKASIPAV
jgi:hypothetical protein